MNESGMESTTRCESAGTASSDTRKLRVALVLAVWPGDISYLVELSKHVQLSVHHSNWLPRDQDCGPVEIPGVTIHSHSPLIRTERANVALCYPGLAKALSRDRADVVHVVCEPWGLPVVQAARWAAAHPGAKLVAHGCDTIWHHGRPAEQLARRAILRYTMPRLDAYVAENSKALALARANGLRADAQTARIHTNPRDGYRWCPPTAPERACARAALKLDEHTVAIGFCGRLVEQKGVLRFVEAARSLLSQGFQGEFFVAGSGPLTDQLKACAPAGLNVVGSLGHPEGVRGFLHALDVFSCPSLSTASWEDQGPRALLEAMMCGVVPMGTPTGGIPEMLGSHGQLSVDTGAESIAEAIAIAATISSDQRPRTAVAEYAASLYSAESAADQFSELWGSVTTVGAGRRR